MRLLGVCAICHQATRRMRRMAACGFNLSWVAKLKSKTKCKRNQHSKREVCINKMTRSAGSPTEIKKSSSPSRGETTSGPSQCNRIHILTLQFVFTHAYYMCVCVCKLYTNIETIRRSTRRILSLGQEKQAGQTGK